MSLFDRFLNRGKKENDPEPGQENEKNINPDESSGAEPEEGGSFLDVIDRLAAAQRTASSDILNIRSNDINSLSPDDYSRPVSSDESLKKIEELKSIISSIEEKPVVITGKKLEKKYKIDYNSQLNPAQLEAVTTTDGPVLVIAGAGSGKTRVVVHRVAFMLENGINPGEILLLTFTRKASTEMLNRVQELLRDNSAGKILGGTFHSFSNYILRKYSGLLGIPPDFTIIDSEDSADTIDLIKSELKIEKKDKAFPKKNRIQEIISSARNRNLTISEVIRTDFTGLTGFINHLEMIGKGYDRYKKACRIFDYDDLMDVLRDNLRDNLSFRKKLNNSFRYIMVDEYQDTNVVQKEIVEFLSEGHRNIMVVGDDAQSIYSFRGANYENILRFPQKYPDCRVIKIMENYRSSQKILDFTNSIIENAIIGYKKHLFSRITNEMLPFVKKFYDQQTEAEFIADRLLEYREKGVAINRIAILVRAFWHARYIEAELNKRSIPYVAVGGIAFNERKHVKDIISYLRIVQNQYDAVAWLRILKYLPAVGTATARKIIDGIINGKGLHTGSFAKTRFFKSLDRLARMIEDARNPAYGISHKIEIIQEYYSPILQATEPDFPVRMLDINVLIELSSRYETLDKFLSDFALDPPSKKFGTKTIPLIDESEEKPLTISTIHSAKGLEWLCVFIPHALDGLIPSVRSVSNIEELEEERRLFYVACSRAKQDLYITMPSFVATYNSFLSYPSRFLLEIDRSRFRYE